MAARTVRTIWKGTLQAGTGHLELGDLKVGVVELARSTLGVHQASFSTNPSHTGDDATATTSAAKLIAAAAPDELIAASYSASFMMQLVTEITQAGGTPNTIEVFADAHLFPDPNTDQPHTNGPGITIAVHGEVDGLDDAGFTAAAATAKKQCPIGKALAGLEVNLATIFD